MNLINSSINIDNITALDNGSDGTSMAHFGNVPVWYNPLIRIENRPIFYYDWSHVGVNQAKDLLDQMFDFLKYKDFKNYYKVNTTFFKVLRCRLCPSKIKKVFLGPGYDEL